MKKFDDEFVQMQCEIINDEKNNKSRTIKNVRFLKTKSF